MTTHRNISTFRMIQELLTLNERKSALLLVAMMVVGMVLETLGIGLVIPVIALMSQENLVASYPALQPALESIGNPSQKALIIGGMIMLVGIYLIRSLFLALLSWRQTHFAFGVQAHLSQSLFTTYLHQPYAFHLQRNSAQLIHNATREIEIFIFNGILPAMLLLSEGLVLLGIGSLMIIVEPLGALIVALVLGGAAWGVYQVTRTHILRWGLARHYHDGLRLQHLQQGLGAVKEVKLLGREVDFLARYDSHNTQCAQAGQFQATLQQLPRLWLELLAVTGIATLVLIMIAQGRETAVFLPTLGLFSAAAFRLMPSVNRVLSAIQSLRYGLPVIKTLYEEHKLSVDEPHVDNYNNAVPFKQAINLTDISYTYPDAPEPALNQLSLVIHKGESVGFVGPSGSGKSTLVDVVLGLLMPNAGQVVVDGQNIQNNLRSWQNQIGYVPQSIYLTDDTLRRNIAFGLPSEQIDDNALRRAIKAAQLDEFVDSLPDRLETIVGERGVRLSGGQRQRIGIARALYHDPSVLVLDEATSALDTDTEQGVIEAVNALHGNKTLLIVAHRFTTVAECDRIYRLEQGRIVEEGTFDSVIKVWKTAAK